MKELSKTKKIIYGVTISAIAVTAIAVPTAITLTNKDTSVPSYNVTVGNNLDGGDNYTITVKKGIKIKDLVPTPREGYEFKGWFKDLACTEQFDDDAIVNSETVIYAKWELKTFALSISLPTGASFHFYKENGEQYTEQELSNIKYGSTIKFEITADDEDSSKKYFYSMSYQDETLVYENVEGRVIYSVALTSEDPIALLGRFEYNTDTTNAEGQTCVTIENYKNYADSATIEVPDTILGLPVSYIGNLTGGDLSTENTVVTKVVLPKYLEDFDAEYMGLFVNLSKITVASSNEYMSSSQNIVFKNVTGGKSAVFAARKSNVSSVTLPSDTVSIGKNAFEDCLNIHSINFEELTNLTKIDDFAFTNSGITTAHLPSSVTYIGFSAFNACQNLTSVKVSGNVELGTKEYSSDDEIIDGITYNSYITFTHTFANCPSIEYIYWDTGMTVVGENFSSRHAITLFYNSATKNGCTLELGANTKAGIKHLQSTGEGSYASSANLLPLIIKTVILKGEAQDLTHISDFENIYYESEKSMYWPLTYSSCRYSEPGTNIYLNKAIFDSTGKELQQILNYSHNINGDSLNYWQLVESDKEGYYKYVVMEGAE